MNRPILVTCLCVAAAAGCTRTVLKETVVEKPVPHETIVERPVVVDRPVVRERVIERPAVAEAYPSCNYGGVGYSHGNLSCQLGYQYRCDSGAWVRIPGSAC